MIQPFVDRFMANKDKLKEMFLQKHPESYQEIVRAVIEIVTDEDEYNYGFNPDPTRISEYDYGNYQGTLLFIVAAKGSGHSEFWYVKIAYGSCSGCDTLQAIGEYSLNKPTEQQANDYLTLALHIVQRLKKMED